MSLHEIIGDVLLAVGLATIIGGFIWNKMVVHPEDAWF